MRRFDYSFLDYGLLPARWLNLSAGIVSLKTMAGVRKREQLRIFIELEQLAKIQSVKSSNAIEGIVTGEDRIAAIVNQNSTPLDHNEAEIAGYRDALQAFIVPLLPASAIHSVSGPAEPGSFEDTGLGKALLVLSIRLILFAALAIRTSRKRDL